MLDVIVPDRPLKCVVAICTLTLYLCAVDLYKYLYSDEGTEAAICVRCWLAKFTPEFTDQKQIEDCSEQFIFHLLKERKLYRRQLLRSMKSAVLSGSKIQMWPNETISNRKWQRKRREYDRGHDTEILSAGAPWQLPDTISKAQHPHITSPASLLSLPSPIFSHCLFHPSECF